MRDIPANSSRFLLSVRALCALSTEFWQSQNSHLFYHYMVLLERFNSSLTAITILYRLNPLYSRNSPSERFDVAYLVLQAHFANCFTVFCVIAFCFWCIDYKANFLVHNTAESRHVHFARLKVLTQPFTGLQIILTPESYPQHQDGRHQFCLQLRI